METAYDSYLYDLSGLDDNLNQSWIGPLAQVTSSRLAAATVRQAVAILHAHEHGVGILRDDRTRVQFSGPDAASLVDCQDEVHFYLVYDSTGDPDPGVIRAYFVGSAQLVRSNGQWLVDVFTTTHTECNF